MGPILIFDKSFLESLNPDEAVWLDNFFLSNITPLFFIETLADLEKNIRSGRTPEDVVGNLAYKTPDASSRPNVHHASLLYGELSGAGSVEMEHGRPIISGGRAIELGGKTGIVFQASPEEEAFQRWQDGQFLELERNLAKAWRRGLSGIDLDQMYRGFQKFFPIGKPKTLGDVKKLVEFHVSEPDQGSVLRFGLSLIGISPGAREEIVKRWIAAGKPQLREFAPYFVHVLSVDLFFYLAIAADLIGRGRPSHKIDVAYLYYLPFCMVFTSNDKLHADIAPFFLRPDQSFVPGTDLKKDLGELDKHYDALPEATKRRGVMSFAHNPPHDERFLVTRLWDKHMSSSWRERLSAPRPEPDSPEGKEILEELRRFKEEGRPLSTGTPVDSDEADHIMIERKVLPRKGKWMRLPPEVINRRKNEKGEWEDIEPVNE